MASEFLIHKKYHKDMATKRIDELPELPSNEEIQEGDKLPFWQSLNGKTLQATWSRFVGAIFKRSSLRVNDQGTTSEIPANSFGLEVDRGGNNPYLVWDDTNSKWMIRDAGGTAYQVTNNGRAVLRDRDETITGKYTIQNQLDVAGNTTVGGLRSDGFFQVVIGDGENKLAPIHTRVGSDLKKAPHLMLQDKYLTPEINGNDSGPAMEFISNRRLARIEGVDERSASNESPQKGALLFKTADEDAPVVGGEVVHPFGYKERMRINWEGNVGIGTHNPSERLDVDGNIKTSGDLTVEGDLNIQGKVNQTSVNELNVGDHLLRLNSEQTGVPLPSLVSGIEVNRGSNDNSQLIWDESDDKWKLNDGTGNKQIATLEDISNSPSNFVPDSGGSFTGPVGVMVGNTSGIYAPLQIRVAPDAGLGGNSHFKIQDLSLNAQGLTGNTGPTIEFQSSIAFAKITGVDLRENTSAVHRGGLIFKTRYSTSGPEGGFQERMRIDSEGNVGIGVINPSSTLHVGGTIEATQALFTGLTTNAGASQMLVLGADNSVGLQAIPSAANFLPIGGGTLTGPLTVNGNLTVNATATFTDQANFNASVSVNQVNGGGTDISIQAPNISVTGNQSVSGSLTTASIQVSDFNGSAGEMVITDGQGNLSTQPIPASPTNFVPSDIGGTFHGNVGIGVVSPTKPLQVNGTLEATNAIFTGLVADGSATQMLVLGTDNSVSLQNIPTAANDFVQKSGGNFTGNVGIGVPNPTKALQVNGTLEASNAVLTGLTTDGTASQMLVLGAGNSIRVQNIPSSSNDFVSKTGGTFNGNVGIGVVNPSEAFEVSGTVRADQLTLDNLPDNVGASQMLVINSTTKQIGLQDIPEGGGATITDYVPASAGGTFADKVGIGPVGTLTEMLNVAGSVSISDSIIASVATFTGLETLTTATQMLVMGPNNAVALQNIPSGGGGAPITDYVSSETGGTFNGNVGIGVINPTLPLEVAGTLEASNAKLTNLTTNGSATQMLVLGGDNSIGLQNIPVPNSDFVPSSGGTFTGNVEISGDTKVGLLEAGTTAYLSGNATDNWGLVVTIQLTARYQQEAIVLDLMAGNGSDGKHATHRVALRVQQDLAMSNAPYFGGFSLESGSESTDSIQVNMYLTEDTSGQKTVEVYASNPFEFSRLKYQIVHRSGTSSSINWNQEDEEEGTAANLPSGYPTIQITPLLQQTQGTKLAVNGELEVSGATTLGSLGGNGEQMVVVDNTGALTTQAIPNGGNTTAKRISTLTAIISSFEKPSGESNTQYFEVHGLNLGLNPNTGFPVHDNGTITGIAMMAEITGDNSATALNLEIGINSTYQTGYTVTAQDGNGTRVSAGADNLNIAIQPGDAIQLRLDHSSTMAEYTLTGIICTLLVEYDA
ncbi:MAG TPA: hypothetical protein DCR93_17250 [Cytophagales bacterium]|nr:hypothetical protein [Cytophagales bacterium]